MFNSNSTLTPSKNISNKDKRILGICNGFECHNKPISKIKVDCGRFGVITLSLCENCAKLFIK
jgi:phosphoribosylformylglycinamidine (FGAM) synthase-like amidotransferase family enzyme